MGATTYETLEGELLDLTELPPQEAAFVNEMLDKLRARMPYREFSALVYGPRNPVLAHGHRVTREVAANPVYRAVRDMEDRLAIIHGELRPGPNDLPADTDPVTDSWVPFAKAAEEKGITVSALRLAVERGDVIGTTSRPRLVSARSLARWSVDRVRQGAGKGLQKVAVGHQ